VYSVEFLPGAARQLARLDPSLQRRIARVVDRLAVEPRGHGCVKLRGAEDVWRIRVGDYRVLYQIADERLLILVVAVGHRAAVYRR